jgi:mannose-6-phosphate isomerase-like protein (cupin superfamily)
MTTGITATPDITASQLRAGTGAASPEEGSPSYGPPLHPRLLVDIASGLAAAPPLWRAVARHDTNRRRPVRLLVTDHYEAWVIGWTTDQGTRLHDHGDSTGALVVTAGELTEVLPCSDGLGERTLDAGRIRTFPVGTVHDIINRNPEPATSIHVYSPPLTTMTYYERDSLQPTETIQVRHEEPLFTSRAGARLLHPASHG